MIKRNIEDIFLDINSNINNFKENKIDQQFQDFVENHKKTINKRINSSKLSIGFKEVFGSFLAAPVGIGSGLGTFAALAGSQFVVAAGLASVAAGSLYLLANLKSNRFNPFELRDIKGEKKLNSLENLSKNFENEQVQIQEFFKHINKEEMAKGDESYKDYIKELQENNPNLYTQLAINVGGDVLKGYARYTHEKMLENGESEYLDRLKEIKNNGDSFVLIEALREEIGKDFIILEQKADREIKLENEAQKIRIESKSIKPKSDIFDKYGLENKNSNKNKNF